jgi:hypothetical protein
MTTALRVGYIGNFNPEHSTENHVKTAFERVGHEVVPLQENDADTWRILTDNRVSFDFVLWTRTGWDWPHDTGWTWEQAVANQERALDDLSERGTPTVGFHLDRWWGLNRTGQVYDEPFFQCDLVITADGGHPDEWADVGVNHHWLPPGVSLAECERTPQTRALYARTPIVWVGSWQRYHEEWVRYRHQLIGALRGRFRRDVGLYPRRGQAVRGQDLVDLYETATVVVGDSCLAGNAHHYWSDRIPETVGRRGFLIHPEVVGLDEHFTVGEHLVTYPVGDWEALCDLVDRYLVDDEGREYIRNTGKAHVMEHHTYERRAEQIVDLVAAL